MSRPPHAGYASVRWPDGPTMSDRVVNDLINLGKRGWTITNDPEVRDFLLKACQDGNDVSCRPVKGGGYRIEVKPKPGVKPPPLEPGWIVDIYHHRPTWWERLRERIRGWWKANR